MSLRGYGIPIVGYPPYTQFQGNTPKLDPTSGELEVRSLTREFVLDDFAFNEEGNVILLPF